MYHWQVRLMAVFLGMALHAAALAGGTATLTVTPWRIGDTVNFGNILLGQSSAPQGTTLTLTSAPAGGYAQIQGINVVGSGDFAPTLGGGNCNVGTTFTTGQACSLPTVFTPSSTGQKTGTLRITCQTFVVFTAATVLCNGVEQTIVSLLGTGFVVSHVPVMGQWGASLLGLFIFGLAALQLRHRP